MSLLPLLPLLPPLLPLLPLLLPLLPLLLPLLRPPLLPPPLRLLLHPVAEPQPQTSPFPRGTAQGLLVAPMAPLQDSSAR
jgi:hypothetical protein